MDLLKEIKQAVLNIEPDSEIYLFGSRARGDHTEDSDWDLLVLLKNKFNYNRKRNILNAVLDIELKNNLFINVIVHSQDKWQKNELLHASPFYNNVIHDYVSI